MVYRIPENDKWSRASRVLRQLGSGPPDLGERSARFPLDFARIKYVYDKLLSVRKNLSKRAHVILPADAVADVDKLVGKRGRSTFVAGAARDEIQRRQQRNALHAAKGAWKDEDHPELKDGAAVWLSQTRVESEKRFQEIERHRDRS